MKCDIQIFQMIKYFFREEMFSLNNSWKNFITKTFAQNTFIALHIYCTRANKLCKTDARVMLQITLMISHLFYIAVHQRA